LKVVNKTKYFLPRASAIWCPLQMTKSNFTKMDDARR